MAWCSVKAPAQLYLLPLLVIVKLNITETYLECTDPGSCVTISYS
jgi:hypothetical protein